MGGPDSKLWLKLDTDPILVWTLRNLSRARLVDGIVVVVRHEDCARARELCAAYGLPKIAQIVPGGASRQESVCLGFETLPANTDLVLVHDGARPFIDPLCVDRVVEAGAKYGAAILAIPLQDTVKQVHDARVVETVSRKALWAAQTPQVFRYALFSAALDRARCDRYVGTDEASLVERLDHPVHVLPGSPKNLKVTTPDDLALAEATATFYSNRNRGDI